MMQLQLPLKNALVVDEDGNEFGRVDHIVWMDNQVFVVIVGDEEPEDGAKEPIPLRVVSNDSVL